MKSIKTLSLIILLASLFTLPLMSQEVKRLTLDDVVSLAAEQSPNALMAKHRFRASYWQYRTFVAEYRPALTLAGNLPDYSTAYSRVWNSVTEQYDYASTNVLQTSGSLVLGQNIGLTGGSISLLSDLTYEKDFERNSERFITAPLNVRLTQPPLTNRRSTCATGN
ncbi:MAG: hypothetical protein LC630_05675 [Bacteroidales bacterium]|nr:hypothetical protein [Bacteroidales bacterium]